MAETTTIHMKVPQDGDVLLESEVRSKIDLIFTASTSQESLDACTDIFTQLSKQPQKFRTIEQFKVLDTLSAAAGDKKSGTRRESAMIGYSALPAIFIPATRCSEVLFIEAVPFVLDGLADKGAVVRESAQYAVDELFTYLPGEALASNLLSVLQSYLTRPASKWQGKVGALGLISKLAKKAASGGSAGLVITEILNSKLEDLIPVVEGCMVDLKAEVSKTAVKTMQAITGLIDKDSDVKPHIPLLIDNMAKPSQALLQKAMKALSQTTFIHPVNSPVLAIVTPLLHRVLSNPSTSQEMLRQTVIIIENLTKLVHNPIEARTFLPQLIPGVQRVRDHAALPEVRSLAENAMNVVEKSMRGEGGREDFVDFRVSVADVEGVFAKKIYIAGTDATFYEKRLKPYLVTMVRERANIQESNGIADLLEGYLIDLLDQEQAKSCAEAVQDHYVAEERKRDSRSATPDTDEVVIVDTPFSLAYGTMLLLSHTRLRLAKGHRYCLCGRNGAGKSTLMRSISEGKLEGFPYEDVRVCFVEHNLQGEDAALDITTFISNDENLIIEGGNDKDVRRKKVEEALEGVGFDAERRQQQVGALSGGWKMKLELARAMLMKADILLLDGKYQLPHASTNEISRLMGRLSQLEPTNHMDHINVNWLQDYLIGHTDITSLIVSHDNRFIDTVCTDILYYDNKKLSHYRGNLSYFMKKRPEVASFYNLQKSEVKFKFPQPGLLTGVRSMTRSILKMSNVTFTYPGAVKPSILNATVQLSLSSRVAILGPNGAGKSTLIKLLLQELIPQVGMVSSHPNARVSYVPQHALEYVNMHLEKTPMEYMRWRFGNGDDKETALKTTRQVSEEEKVLMETPVNIDGKGPKKIEKIIGRQKFKKSFQYEIKWQNMLPKHNIMVSRETLTKLGFSKMVQDFDDKESAREGLSYRELTVPALKQHFEDVTLPEEIAAHNQIQQLSGGQRVKVVLAAATWNNPHIIILDEPSNFLDVSSLGGLSYALKEFKGGVVVISHNAEFIHNLMNEEWVIENGKVTTKGGNYDTGFDSRPGSSAASRANSAPSSAAASGTEDNADSDANLGFKAKKVKKKKLTRNELKEREARRRLRHLEWLNSPKGTPKPKDSDEE